MEYVQPVGGLANDPYLDANPVGGIEGSPVPAAAIEHPMRELVALIADAGLAPTGASLTQVAAAVRTLMQKQAASISVAGGTADAITAAYSPVIAALVNGMTLQVRAASVNATATPTFTPASPAIAAKTIVKGNNLPLVAGDIAGAGHWVELRYDATLDKWVIANPAKGISSASPAVQGAAKNLVLSTTGTNASISVGFDELVIGNGAGEYAVDRNIAATINTATLGAGGLDTGALAATTWYSVWRIGKSDGTRSWLISLHATAPTMPVGYTLKARIGWVRTDGTGNKYPLPLAQVGNKVKWRPASGTNMLGLPVIISGVQGNPATPTWVAASVTSAVPTTTATMVDLLLAGGGAVGNSAAAPNNSYGSNASLTNPPPLATFGAAGNGASNIQATLALESANVYYASGAASALAVTGWEDSL